MEGTVEEYLKNFTTLNRWVKTWMSLKLNCLCLRGVFRQQRGSDPNQTQTTLIVDQAEMLNVSSSMKLSHESTQKKKSERQRGSTPAPPQQTQPETRSLRVDAERRISSKKREVKKTAKLKELRRPSCRRWDFWSRTRHLELRLLSNKRDGRRQDVRVRDGQENWGQENGRGQADWGG